MGLMKMVLFCGICMSFVGVYSQALLQSITNGEIDKVKELVDNDATLLNEQYEEGNLPVHIAVHENRQDIVKYIIEQDNEMLEKKNELGLTPLNMAARDGYKDIMVMLLEMGADMENGDREGSVPIHNAAASGNLEIVKYLIEEKNIDINTTDNFNVTPFFFAAQSGNLELVKYLANRGADINHTTANCINSFFAAAYSGNADVIQYLAEKGMDIHALNIRGSNALHNAAFMGHSEAVQMLLSLGADMNKENNNAVTPFNSAVFGGHIDVCRVFIENGYDVHRIDGQGRSPLHIAVNSTIEMVDFLLETGLDINSKNNFGSTPLINSVYNNNLEMIRHLIEKGADINLANNDGITPLIASCWSDGSEITEYLIAKGADVNIMNKDTADNCVFQDGSALHIAARKGNYDIVSKLLENEADVNRTDDTFRRTALHYAAIKGYADIVKLLLEKGADRGIIDSKGKTAEDYAWYHSNKNIVPLLNKNYPLIEYVKLVNEDVANGDASIWYLHHSGWAIKTEKHFLIFDYWENGRRADKPGLENGYIDPEAIKDLDVIVFVTHEHRDHFDPIIFSWKDVIPNISYVMGCQPNADVECTIMEGRQEQVFGDVKVTTVSSNDSGVGYLVDVDGLTVYHPGDHANRMRDFSGNFMTEIEFLQDKIQKLDLTFFPVSGCNFHDLEAVKMGALKTFEYLKPVAAFPMHSGANTIRYFEFAENAKEANIKTNIYPPLNCGSRYTYKSGEISEK